MSMIGHILTRTWRDGHNESYPIIASYTSRLGKEYLVIAKWNDHSQTFFEYSTDSYLFEIGQMRVSGLPMVMGEAQKAMSRAYRIQRLLKKSTSHIQMIKACGGVATVLKNEVLIGYRDRFSSSDKATWQLQADEGDFVEIDGHWLETAKARHQRLVDLFKAEMLLAGIEL